MPPVKDIRAAVADAKASAEPTAATPIDAPVTVFVGAPAAKPAAAPVAVVAPAATPVAGTLSNYKVELKDNPAVVIRAWDRLDAIEKYKVHCGILASIHEFKIDPVA